MHLAGVIVTVLGPKRDRNKGEQAAYEAAIKKAIRELAPRDQVRGMIEGYEKEIADQRARAEELNRKRQAAKQQPPVLQGQGG